MADFDQLMGQVVDAWLKRSKHVTAATIAVGQGAQRVLRHQLRRVDDPGERRTVRADAVERIVMRLQAVGARISAAGLCRAVQIAMVAKCFDESQAKTLPVNTLKAFCGVIIRDKRNETWGIREKVLDQATTLWSRVVAGEIQPADVADQVRIVLGKKPPKPRAKTPPVQRVIAAVAKLPGEQQRQLYLVLHKQFGDEVKTTPKPSEGADVQVSVPMGDPPGQVAEEEKLSIRERMMMGRRRAG